MRFPVTVDATNAAYTTTQYNVPVPVRLPQGSPVYSATESNGADVRFVTSNDSAQLPHDVERYTETGESILWVSLPALPPGGPLRFWLYTSNSAAGEGQNPAGVWPVPFGAVWHGNHLAGGTGVVFLDASPRGLHADFSALNGYSPGVDGPLASAMALPGNTYVTVTGSDTDLLLGAIDALTISAWVNVTGVTAHGIIMQRRQFQAGQYSFRMDAAYQGRLTFSRDDAASNSCRWVSTTPVPVNAWHHVAVTMDTAGNNIQFYLDGILDPVGLVPACGPGWLAGMADNVFGGRPDNNPPYYSDTIVGQLDELRVERAERPAGWIWMQVQSQKSGTVTVGAGEPY